MINLNISIVKNLIKISFFSFVMFAGFAATSGICCSAQSGNCDHPTAGTFTNATWVGSQYCNGHECPSCPESIRQE
tara:strand:+ start:261 stop:488 length:228 start_codon:yes stop_codon:yes gene_type:complete